MASRKIKWPSNAFLSRKSTSTFYSYFSTVSKEGETHSYSIGECVPVRVHRRVAVMLAEIVELSVDDYEIEEDEADSLEKVKIRLYAYPQDTPSGRTHIHGEHELLMFYKHVVLTCKQFLSIEQRNTGWNCGIPLQPSSEPHPLPPSPSPSSRSSTSSITSLLYCYEPMIPIGLFEYEEQSGLSPCSSPIANRALPTLHSHRPRIKVVPYLVYCRYRAVLARFGGNSAYQYMNSPAVRGLGGIPVPCVSTVMMFCKKTFRDITLERKLNFCISKEVTYSITDRRPSSSLSPSPPSTTSSDNASSLNILNRCRGRPLKRRRGRPRKDQQTDSGKDEIMDNDCDDESVFDDPSKQEQPSNCESPSSNKKYKLNNDEETLVEGDGEYECEPPIVEPSPRKRSARLIHRTALSPKRRNCVPQLNHDQDDEESPMINNAKKHIVQPAAMVTPDGETPVVTSNYNPAASISVVNSKTYNNPGENTPTKHSSTMTTNRAVKDSSSRASLVDSEMLIHSLRPRSSLLPPPQFRDESYDMESDRSTRSSSSEAKSVQTVTKTERTKDDTSSVTPTPTPDSTSSSSNTDPNVSSPLKTSGGVTVTKLPLATAGPPDYKSSKSLSTADLTQDVKELLKAYLSCLKASTVNESLSETVNSHLEAQLIDERQFLDLLFCFMKMRKTPIHRVPRLGSRNLNLFELYKVTTMLGGYEQVTINRKWSYVFDSLGCAAGMTCASTVTRKHYEKLLLPFERALGAVKK